MSTHTYPFSTPKDYKSVVSMVDIDFEFENAGAGLFNAMDDVQDVISEEMWILLLNHFNSANYDSGNSYENLDKAVQYLRYGFGHLALYHNFDLIQIRISNNAITTYKSDKETTAYKYQLDQAKEKLLKVTWGSISKLIVLMNNETSNFDGWDDTDQYTDQKNMLFASYKEFDKIYGIDKNAAFYQKCASIINRNIADFLQSRVEDVFAETDKELLVLFKKFLVFATLSEAVEQFDVHYLPAPIRASLNNEFQRKNSNTDQTELREKQVNKFWNQAENHLQSIDIHIAGKNEPEADSYGPLDNLQKDVQHDDKYINLL